MLAVQDSIMPSTKVFVLAGIFLLFEITETQLTGKFMCCFFGFVVLNLGKNMLNK